MITWFSTSFFVWMDKAAGRTFERWAAAVFFIKGGPRYMVIHVDLAKQRSQALVQVMRRQTKCVRLICRFHQLFFWYFPATGHDQVVHLLPSVGEKWITPSNTFRRLRAKFCSHAGGRLKSCMCLQSTCEARSTTKSGMTSKTPVFLLWYEGNREWLPYKARPCGRTGKCIIRTCY